MSWFDLVLFVCGVTLEQLRQEFSDRELVEMASKQDAESKEAFQVLVERHQKWMVGFLAHMLSNQHDAEDLAQNVFVRAFFALPKFRGDSSFRTWLRVIASREAFNHYRKRGDRPTDPEDFNFMVSQEGDQERVHEREALAKALKQVPYPYREILVLRYIEEMDLQQIGEVLELGKSATKMRLKRAREFFQKSWDENVL